LIILFTDKKKPFINPCFLNELIEYSEHVGVYLQLAPINGDMKD